MTFAFRAWRRRPWVARNGRPCYVVVPMTAAAAAVTAWRGRSWGRGQSRGDRPPAWPSFWQAAPSKRLYHVFFGLGADGAGRWRTGPKAQPVRLCSPAVGLTSCRGARGVAPLKGALHDPARSFGPDLAPGRSDDLWGLTFSEPAPPGAIPPVNRSRPCSLRRGPPPLWRRRHGLEWGRLRLDNTK